MSKTGINHLDDILESHLISMKSFEYFSTISSKNISLNVGDFVVHADWDIPEEMLKIKRIKNIIIKPPKGKTIEFAHQGKLFLILEDSEKRESLVSYVDFYNMFIYDGSVRKATTEYESLKINDKVKIKNKNSLFRKSDVFYIAAFVEDIHSSEPFVLLSNYTLVKYSKFISNYIVISKEDKKYEKLTLSESPKVSSIKKQWGDKFIYVDLYDKTRPVKFDYYLIDDEYSYGFRTQTHFYANLLGNNKNTYIYKNSSFDREKRFGFITERFSSSDILMLKNMHAVLRSELEKENNPNSSLQLENVPENLNLKLKRGLLDNYNTIITNIKNKTLCDVFVCERT
jgi:hypothetical protein